MTALRFAHQTRTTTDTRTEAADLPCIGHWYTYDTLIEGHADDVRYAVEAGKALCAACPIQRKCWDDNRDELWVQTLVQGYRRKGRSIRRMDAA